MGTISPTDSALPSRGRLLALAVFLPAAVAVSNELLFEQIKYAPQLRPWLYPWMAASTAVLSWLVGRHLSPGWLRWLVFGWCLALLDLLTIAACLSGPIPRHFSYALISAQISMLTLWAILATANWQWQLPRVLPAAAAVILFSGIFGTWHYDNWKLLMVLITVVIVLVCVGLRLCGFRLQARCTSAPTSNEKPLLAHQFGMKHMIAWMTAIVPILLVFRGLDFLILKRLGGQGTFPLALLALTVATVNLVAIWSVLGGGRWIIRLAVLLLVPLILGTGMFQYMKYLNSVYGARRGWNYRHLFGDIAELQQTLPNWLWLDTALLAALLLFLRASGYRLVRHSSFPGEETGHD
jgi:hypothetical protein